MYTKSKLAALLSTGNNTHAAQSVPDGAIGIAMSFNITAVGATPTITYKLQGSLDTGDTPDVSSAWFDLMVLPGNSDTGLATDTKTALGSYAYFLALARIMCRKVRLVTSANTNVTYDADLAVK